MPRAFIVGNPIYQTIFGDLTWFDWTGIPAAALGNAFPPWNYRLDFTVPGEVVYGGHDLDITDANYGIRVRTSRTRYRNSSPGHEFVFEIRGRRQDADNYFAFRVDYELDQVSIIHCVASVETVLQTESYELPLVGDQHIYFEFWMCEDEFTGFVNGSDVIEATQAGFQTSDGFSLRSINAHDSNGRPHFFTQLLVYNLEYAPPPSLDPDDLDVVKRRKHVCDLEDPGAWEGDCTGTESYDWDTYIYAWNQWFRFRDFGRPDHIWSKLGYPALKPSPEKWFGG